MKCFEFSVGQLLDPDEFILGVRAEYDLVELGLKGSPIPILGVLD
jgi:hypothetical protein